ncbi:hypothetical protein ONZ51_g10604 [Trametes cubensis]|uniref:Uncharacterized protein n=1 Tax=Trametes cubensis TaxID=1111947 RepID=A0AAD7TK74_9APHY|nr:hypothetical protein ONZ51_g10604 [Trametes cubensis]
MTGKPHAAGHSIKLGRPRYKTASDAQSRGASAKSSRYTLEPDEGVVEPGEDVQHACEQEPSERAAKHRTEVEYWPTNNPLEEFGNSGVPLYQTVDPSWLSSSSSALADVEVELDIETAWGCSDFDANGGARSPELDEIEVESASEPNVPCSESVQDVEVISEDSAGESSESKPDDADSF